MKKKKEKKKKKSRICVLKLMELNSPSLCLFASPIFPNFGPHRYWSMSQLTSQSADTGTTDFLHMVHSKATNINLIWIGWLDQKLRIAHFALLCSTTYIRCMKQKQKTGNDERSQILQGEKMVSDNN